MTTEKTDKPDAGELRLREVPVDSDGTVGMAFMAGERHVCDFGAMPTKNSHSIPGEPPSPDDARRMELSWNCHDDLVAAIESLLNHAGWAGTTDAERDENFARDILAKATGAEQ